VCSPIGPFNVLSEARLQTVQSIHPAADAGCRGSLAHKWDGEEMRSRAEVRSDVYAESDGNLCMLAIMHRARIPGGFLSRDLLVDDERCGSVSGDG
jgi:hypothetical protein